MLSDLIEFERLDQEARRILLSSYLSQRQHWGIVLTSIGILILSVSQARELLFLGSYILARITCGVLGTAACYAILNIYWYGALSSPVLRAAPHTSASDEPMSYLSRLEYGILHEVRKSTTKNFVSLILRGKKDVEGLDRYARRVFCLLGIAITMGMILYGKIDKQLFRELRNLGFPRQGNSCFVLVVSVLFTIVIGMLLWVICQVREEASKGVKGYSDAAKDGMSVYKGIIKDDLYTRLKPDQKDDCY